MKFVKYLLVTMAVLVVLYVGLFFLVPISTVTDGKYISHGGRFEVPVPVSDSLGGKRNEGIDFVSFVDDFCALYRIDYKVLPESEQSLLAQMGREKYLGSFLENVYLKTFLEPRFSAGIKIDFSEYLGNSDNGTLYAQIDTPKASVCTLSTDGGPAERRDAKRGTLTLLYGKRIYVITTGPGLVAHIDTKWLRPEASHPSHQSQMLKENTLQFSKSIRFRP